MRAIVIRQPGGPDVLELRDVPDPVPSRGEIVVRVRAAGVNRADVLQRIGHYPAPPGSPRDIPGLEIAGDVEALGDAVTERRVGERVFAIVGGGGYAERLVVHARAVSRSPAGMEWPEAAAIPEAFVTAWDAMVEQGRLRAGETVLVHAAGSGVGTAAVQIAKAAGARAIGTARTAAKLDEARKLGLDEGVVVDGGGKFARAVLDLTRGRGVDVIVDLVGGPYVAEDLGCIATKGRIVNVGLMAGPQVSLDLAALMHKRVELRGTVLRARPLEEKILAARALEANLVPLFESGALRAVVHATLPLARAGEAHQLMESNATFGKIVLTL